MNEGILIAYDDTYYSIGDTLVIQKRLTDILKPCGMRYFTGRSLYKPEDPDRRDDIMYDAMKLLSRCEWIYFHAQYHPLKRQTNYLTHKDYL